MVLLISNFELLRWLFLARFCRSWRCNITAVIGGYRRHVADGTGRPSLTPFFISICGLLFVVAFREAGHPLWAIPAMTLFLLSGMMFVYALSKASRRLLQGPQETTLAVP